VSEPLTREEVAKVAELAMLELTDDELTTFTGQLAAVLDHAKDVEALDVDDVPPTHHPYPLVNVFRSDLVEQLDDVRAEALAAAPEAEDGQFRVPPALGEEM
jgi:aspartyl-tRNA(Asn)/glutamyl-tRNA(Gln) amidotransferase subunit C